MSAFLRGLFDDPSFVAQIEDGIRDRLVGQETDLDRRKLNWDPPVKIVGATVTQLHFVPGGSTDSAIAVSGRANVTVHYRDASDENNEHELTLDGDVRTTISLVSADDASDDDDADLDQLAVDWDAAGVVFRRDVEGEEPPEDDKPAR